MLETLKEATEIIKYKELLRNLVIRDIKVRYKKSALGFLWVMLHPLLMMFVFYVVFSELFKISTKNYTVYLLSGFILWNFFAQSTSTAINGFMGNSALIKKVYLPKAIFPLSVIISAMVHFIFSLLPLSVIFFVTGTSISSQIYILPALVIMVGLFSFGVALILSTLTVFFHDTRYIYDVLLLAWMFLTPIFYPESIIPEKYAFILQLNPVFYFVSVFRTSLYETDPFMYEKLLYCFVFSLAALFVAWLIYSRYKEKIVYYL